MRLLNVLRATALVASLAVALPASGARIVENLFGAKLFDDKNGWVTGAFGVKPAARAAVLSSAATAADGASPTSPQRSQIRNTTRSPDA